MPQMSWDCPVEGCGKIITVTKATRQGLAMTLGACRANHRRAHERHSGHKLSFMFDVNRYYCGKCKSLFATQEAAVTVPCAQGAQ